MASRGRSGKSTKTFMDSQCDKILDCLQSNLGAWVPMPRLADVSGSYVIHSRISDLRERGCNIRNKTETKNGVRHSFYKLEAPL
jgi:hypothetical protein